MSITTTKAMFSFCQGGGEIGELTRNYNWRETTLGCTQHWPESLRTTLSIILHSRLPMFLFWGQEQVCFYNDASRPILSNNGKHPYALGKPGADILPEIWPDMKPLIDQVLAGGEANRSKDQLIPVYRNGQVENVYWTFNYSPVHDESGLPAGVFVTCTETTRTVQMAQELRLSRQRFENLIREATIGIIVLTGEEMRVDVVNSTYGKLINRSPEELTGKPLFSIIPETEAVFRPILDKVRLTGEPLYLYDYPYFVYVNSEKKEGYLNLVYQPYKEADESITGVMVICHDVTEQVTGRFKIERSEQNLRNIISQAPVAIGIFRGRDLVIETPNQAFIDIVGKGSSIIGKPLREAMPELITEGQPFLRILDEVYTSGKMFQTFGTQVKIVQQGILKYNYYDFSYTPLQDNDGNTYAILDIAIDVTDEVLARQKVAEAEERTRMAVEAAELGTFEVNIPTDEIITSSRFNEIYGMNETVERRRYAASLHPDDLSVRQKALQQGLETGIVDYMARVVRKEGTIHWIRVQGKVNFDADKRPQRLLGVVQDITEQVELQHQKDMFLGIASHELKTPVTSIKAYAQILEKMFRHSGDTKSAKLLAKMDNQANRLNNLIADLLDVTKINNGKLQFNYTTFDFNQMVEEVVEEMQYTSPGHYVEKKLVYTGLIVGDKDRLSQVVINFLSNAIKYSPGANRIIVSTERKETEVQLCIQDFGIGISPEKKDRVFEQFYRVSGSREQTFSGLGLGLYISSEIIKRMRGRIWVASTEGEGTTFSFTIPVEAACE